MHGWLKVQIDNDKQVQALKADASIDSIYSCKLSEFKFFQGTIYENVDFITSNIMLPMSAVFITIFAAWVMSKNSSSEELDGHGFVYKIWQLLARYFAPIAILVIFLQAIGWI